MMICYYLSFLIDEIWLDLKDNILLGIILFFVLAKFNLICRAMSLPNYPRLAFGPTMPLFWASAKEPEYCIGRTISLDLASGPASPLF